MIEYSSPASLTNSGEGETAVPGEHYAAPTLPDAVLTEHARALARLATLLAATDSDGLAGQPPSAALAAAVTQSAAATEGRAELLDLLVAANRCVSWLQSVQLGLVDQLTRTRVPGIAETDLPACAQDEVQAELGVSTPRAAEWVMLAGDVADRFPVAGALLADGRVDWGRVRYLAWQARALDTAACAAVEQRLFPHAAAFPDDVYRRAVRRVVAAVDPADAEVRRQRAEEERTVNAEPLPDQMVGLWAELPAAGAAIVVTAIDRHAVVTGPDDARTAGQRRADALVAICDHALTTRPTTGNTVADIQVTVSLDTLLGRDDHPAHLAGYGAITAETVRDLAAGEKARFTRLVIHPQSGALLHLDPRRYTTVSAVAARMHDAIPPAEHSAACHSWRPISGHHPDPYRPTVRQKRLVKARDPSCVFTGCATPAPRCQVDHVTAYEGGGATCCCNLAPECARHHTAKTRQHWNLTRHDDGSHTWTGPSGRRYWIPPYDHRTW